MAFTIRLCPYCGGDISADEPGYYVCEECEKHTFRSRSNGTAFLANKPYESQFSGILSKIEDDPEDCLGKIEALFEETEEPNADMYFTRGNIYCELGEEGKALIDWKKGLELLSDLRYLDAYIVTVCKRIVKLIVMKEREFMEFNPVEYIDSIATDFSLRGEIPCKGIFYITIYRNFRMGLQAGEYDAEDEVYSNIMLKVLKRILAYGRNYQTTSNIIEEVLEDFEYDEETYEEDDNLKLHLCSLIKNHYDALGGNFSDPHIVRIIRHWNDENMFELEYWVDELMKSVKDNSILQALNRFRSVEDEKFDLEEATEDYVRKFLLLSETGEDLSEETQVLQ